MKLLAMMLLVIAVAGCESPGYHDYSHHDPHLDPGTGGAQYYPPPNH